MQNLNEIMNILSQFQKKLEQKQHFFETTRSLNPNFEPVSEKSCREELARCWIYGTDTVGTILGAPLPKISYHSETSQTLASKHYTTWQKSIEKNAAPDTQYTEYFLNVEEFGSYHLDEPKSGETLYDYILRLRDIIENSVKIHFLWERGFSSFLYHLRKTISEKQIAFLELIFPEDMEIRKSTSCNAVQTGKFTWEIEETPTHLIARKISPCRFPIYICTSADIMRELANTVLHGRQNAKLTAAESLGLCWSSLTCARRRLPLQLDDLLRLPKSALEIKSDETLHMLTLPSIFGGQPMPISNTIGRFLKVISDIPGASTRECIFQSPKESLYRCLRRTIEKLNLDPKKGKITFQTFLSQPEEFDHRYQPIKTH